MSLLRRLLIVTFIESFATILVERGIYFFSEERLNFSAKLNLWLALAFGVAYVLGAMSSHRLSVRLTEKRLMLLTIGGQLLFHAALAVAAMFSGALSQAGPLAMTIAVFVGSTSLGCLNGAKWPLFESFVSAGHTPKLAARAVGGFNIAWASAVPVALVAAGPLITLGGGSLFLACVMLNAVGLALLRPIPDRPMHLPHDHPERPAAASVAQLRAMLGFSRWTMFVSYASLWVLAALMPKIFNQFGLPVAVATSASGVIDLMRFGSFAVLQRFAGWHFRWSPVILSALALPVGFAMVIFGPTLGWVLVGEVLFGLAAGVIYYAALYYAMVVTNASVDAGGAHESLIGLGFAVGPLAGLAGATLGTAMGHQMLGVMAGVAPLFAICGLGAAVAALRGRRVPT